MKIAKMWSSDLVRQMCIKHGFCTCCDNLKYSKILDFVSRTIPTDATIAELAAMITAVSDTQGDSPEEFAKYTVIWWLLNDCIIYSPKFN